MFITKKSIPRRTFLQGCGVTLALPFLESMLPAQTPLRQTAAGPGSVRRFVGIWHPHGAAPGYWSPLQEGSSFEFSFITKPLEPLRDRVVLITGLDATGSSPTADEPGGDHARGANLLSGARPRRDSVSPYLGVTIETSGGKIRCCPRFNWESKIPVTIPAIATGVTAAHIPIPSHGRRLQHRFRQKSIRVWSSNGCLVMARVRMNAS